MFPTRATFLVILLVGLGPTPPASAAENLPPLPQPKLEKAYDQPELPPAGPILARAQNSPAIYGLYVWTGEYAQHRDAIKSVGWRTFRVGGPFDDTAMRMFVEDGVDVIKTTGANGKNGPKPDANPAGDEAFIRDHVTHVTDTIRRYGNRGTFFKENPGLPHRPIRLLEAWNEPNFQYLIKPDQRPQAEQEADREALFAKLQPAAYKAAKALDPEIIYGGFAAGGSSAGDLRFVENVHRRSPAVAGSYDVLSTHPYVAHVPPECYCVRQWGRYSIASSLATLRKTMADHGRKDVPVWYTEIGWEVSKKDGGKYDRPIETVPPELQAAYTCRMYAYALRLGVERVTNMFATDTDGYNGGFFLADGTWRPSAHAVKTMIRLMPAPRLVEILSDGTGGTFTYRFSPRAGDDKASVIMLWNVAGPRTVEVPVAASKVSVVGMTGETREAKPTGGVLKVDIGPLPIYLVVGS